MVKMWNFKFSILLVMSLCPLVFPLRPTSNQDPGTSSRNRYSEETEAVRALLQRLLPDKAEQFLITVNFTFEEKDVFEISSNGGKIVIMGNRGYSAAAGLQYYLKTFCKSHISWSGLQLKLPVDLPKPEQSLKIAFNDKYRYYQNVCTYSYSFVWWTWERWEKEIDWMALNGINLALAFTAQEAIFYKVFKQLNFTDQDIEEFFAGPAFLAWNRMGNMQRWGGPLSQNWNNDQMNLQRKILYRMRAFGMTPVLPAFSGRVVPAFKRNFPSADTTVLNKTWGHFQSPYGFVTFLQPSDPLFQQIGTEFLKSYINEFGTNHIYNADLFNEMPPPSSDPNYLQSCARSMYKTLTTVDPEAIWLIQGWMFFSDPDIWQESQARAFLEAIPLGKMIVLDLQSELYPQYQRLSSYYGQPFIWCMLHNYGGVNGLYGSLDSINTNPFQGRKGSSMIGTGLTPEGIGTNDIVYELMNEVAWRKQPVDLHEWLQDYALRRYGTDSAKLELALMYLERGVLNATVPYRNHGKYILIRRPSLKLKPYIWYDPKDVFIAWNLYLNATDNATVSNSKLYKHDLVDLGRQSLQQVMDILYPKVVQSFRRRNVTALREVASSILELLEDMDELLASDEHFLLGCWLSDATQLARDPREKRQYEFNARNQVTLWGPSGELVDYANKQWSGLMSYYYRKRWQFFFKTLDDCIVNKKSFKQSRFNRAVFKEIEYQFNVGEEVHTCQPRGDPIEISQKLFQKYDEFVNVYNFQDCPY